MLTELDDASLERVVGGQGQEGEAPLEQPFDDRRYTRAQLCDQVGERPAFWRGLAKRDEQKGRHDLAAQSRRNAMDNEALFLRYCHGS